MSEPNQDLLPYSGGAESGFSVTNPTERLSQLIEASEITSESLAAACLVDPRSLGDRFSYTDSNVFLGGLDGQLFGDLPENDLHVLVVGGSRGGKGTSVSNTLLTYSGSVWGFTTKTTDALKLYYRRGPGHPDYCDGMGQQVGVYDPYEACTGIPDEVRLNINLFAEIDPSTPEGFETAQRLAEELMPRDAGGGSGPNYFYKDGVNVALTLMLHVCSHPYYEGHRNPLTVYDLACSGLKEVWEVSLESGLLTLDENGNPIETPFSLLWDEIKANPQFDGSVSRRGSQYAEMAEKAAKQFIGVVSELRVALSFLDDKRVANSLSSNDCDFRRLKTDPKGYTVLISIDDGKLKSQPALIRMLFAMLEMAVKAVPGKPACGLPVLGWCDEMASWGRVTSCEQSMATIAGYGLRLVCIFQTTAQITDVYREQGLDKFLSGCPLQIYLDIRTRVDAQLIQTMAGEREVVTLNRTVGWAEGQTTSDGVTDTESTSQNQSTTDGWSKGNNNNTTLNEGGGKSQSFSGGLIDYVIPNRFYPKIIKKMWQKSTSFNWGVSRTTGENEGTSGSQTSGEGSSQSKALNHVDGTSMTGNVGISEARQVRPLLTIDVIQDRYSKFNQETGGLVLVHLCGIGWMEFERVPYWTHEFFFRKYGPDADYEFRQAPMPKALAERSPEAIAVLEAELVDAEACLPAVHNRRFLANVLQGGSLALASGMLLAGAPLIGVVAGAGVYGCHCIKRNLQEQENVVADLRGRLETLTTPTGD